MRGCIILFTVSVLSLGTASAVFFDEYHAPLGEDFLELIESGKVRESVEKM